MEGRSDHVGDGIKVESMEPAVKDTCTVLMACTEAKVKRVVVVSSGAAVDMHPCWSIREDDKCRSIKFVD